MSSSDRSAAALVDPSKVVPLSAWPEPRQLHRSGGQREAYEAGLEAGRAAALQEEAEAAARARRALEGAARALSQAAAELRAVRADALRSDVRDAMALVVEVTEALVGSLPAKVSPKRLEEALALAPEDELAIVRLHPDDAEAALSLPVDAKVVADETVGRGGCVVEVGATRIDAQIGPALARLRAVLGAGPAPNGAEAW
jgi:flagellar assembly protein FliH